MLRFICIGLTFLLLTLLNSQFFSFFFFSTVALYVWACSKCMYVYNCITELFQRLGLSLIMHRQYAQIQICDWGMAGRGRQIEVGRQRQIGRGRSVGRSVGRQVGRQVVSQIDTTYTHTFRAVTITMQVHAVLFRVYVGIAGPGTENCVQVSQQAVDLARCVHLVRSRARGRGLGGLLLAAYPPACLPTCLSVCMCYYSGSAHMFQNLRVKGGGAGVTLIVIPEDFTQFSLKPLLSGALLQVQVGRESNKYTPPRSELGWVI